MNKAQLLSKIIAHIESDLNVMRRAAIEARDSVIHADSKQEGKYDTRAIEASYLAGAQAERAADQERLIGVLRLLSPNVSQKTLEVRTGSFVEAVIDQVRAYFFIVPEGGGLSIDHEGQKIQVIAAKSPLGQTLLGREIDDEFEFEAGGRKKNVVIQNVQ